MESSDAEAYGGDNSKSCCICLQNIPSGASVFLPCGHDEFCGQCLVDYLQRDVRCPLCRQGGPDDENESVVSDEEGAVMHFNTHATSMKKARKDKKNKQTFKSLTLIAKWRKEAGASMRQFKELSEKTRDPKKILLHKLRLYETKLDAAYSSKYGAIEKQMKDLRKQANKARGRVRAIERRLHRKYASAA